jgi:hypothetical protein
MSNDHRVAVRVAHAVLLAIYDRSAPTLSPTLSPTLAVLALLAIYRMIEAPRALMNGRAGASLAINKF